MPYLFLGKVLKREDAVFGTCVSQLFLDFCFDILGYFPMCEALFLQGLYKKLI